MWDLITYPLLNFNGSALNNKEEVYHTVSTKNWDEIGRASHTLQAFDLLHLTELYENTSQKSEWKIEI